MNSLPLISHHLFVAAIGDEGRAPDRSIRGERPSALPVEQASAITLEVMDARKTGVEETIRASRARITHVRD